MDKVKSLGIYKDRLTGEGEVICSAWFATLHAFAVALIVKDNEPPFNSVLLFYHSVNS